MSRAFRFALQPLLEHWQAKERAALAALSAAQHGFSQARCRAGALREELKLVAAQMLQPAALDRSPYYARLEYLHRALRQHSKILCSRADDVQRKRPFVVAAAQKRKALQLLRTRREQAHALREELLEQREIDEGNLAVQNARRRGH